MLRALSKNTGEEKRRFSSPVKVTYCLKYSVRALIVKGGAGISNPDLQNLVWCASKVTLRHHFLVIVIHCLDLQCSVLYCNDLIWFEFSLNDLF